MKLATALNDNIVESIVDGDGLRLVLFTQGCVHKCKGCHNPSTWSFSGGYNYEVEDVAKFIISKYEKAKSFYSGITISGGDPLCQMSETYKLIKLLREYSPSINIWLYTGYEKDDVYSDFTELLDLVNVVVTGKYVEDLRTSLKKFVGSSNQEIIKVK